MPSVQLQPRARGASLGRLNPQQQMFVKELVADPCYNPTVAARKAGYAAASVQANKLMKNKVVLAYIGKVIHERLARIDLVADDVLEHLKNGLFLDPIHLFAPGPNGSFVVKQLDQIPEHLRRCITKIKSKTRTWTENEEEITETWFEMEFMSKDALMPLAMKHLGIQGIDQKSVNVNVESKETLLITLINEVTAGSNVVDDTDDVIDVVSTPPAIEDKR